MEKAQPKCWVSGLRPSTPTYTIPLYLSPTHKVPLGYPTGEASSPDHGEHRMPLKRNPNMNYNPDLHHRRSIRLKEYDYSRAGAYSVTICTQNRECLFGNITNREMRLNDAGVMIQTVWDETGHHYSGIETDEFIIMPNHIHDIILIAGAVRPDNEGTDRMAETTVLFLSGRRSRMRPRYGRTPGNAHIAGSMCFGPRDSFTMNCKL